MNKMAHALTALTLTGAMMMAGCGRTDAPSGDSSTTTPTGTSTGSTADPSSQNIIVGTTDQIVALDPAGSYDTGSGLFKFQIYQFLYGFGPNDKSATPDAATSCGFTAPTVFTCTLKPGLKFANGDDLTSSDVKFSFDRIKTINSPQGPQTLLSNLASVDAPDPLTVTFNLKNPNDQTFEQVLGTSVGPIVDEQVFSPTQVTSDDDIIKANAFSGPYTITTYNKNQTAVLVPNPNYNGNNPKPNHASITVQTFTDATNMKLSISNGQIDVAYRSLAPTDIAALQSDPSVKVWQEPGGEIRYITFNLNTMPGDNDAQKLAIRQAIASLVDRDALSKDVYKGQYAPLCSYVPSGYAGANTAVCDTYPLDKTAAAKYLSDAGLATPVKLSLEYNTDHYGSSSDQEYTAVKQQLENSGLFTVDLQSAAWSTYSKERTQDSYPIYQMGWFPAFPDSDTYLTPFFSATSFLGNHFNSPEIQQMLTQEVSETDAAARTTEIGNIQTTVAQKYLPTLPLLQGSQWAVTRTNVTGVSLNVSQLLMFTTLVKN